MPETGIENTSNIKYNSKSVNIHNQQYTSFHVEISPYRALACHFHLFSSQTSSHQWWYTHILLPGNLLCRICLLQIILTFHWKKKMSWEATILPFCISFAKDHARLISDECGPRYGVGELIGKASNSSKSILHTIKFNNWHNMTFHKTLHSLEAFVWVFTTVRAAHVVAPRHPAHGRATRQFIIQDLHSRQIRQNK